MWGGSQGRGLRDISQNRTVRLGARPLHRELTVGETCRSWRPSIVVQPVRSRGNIQDGQENKNGRAPRGMLQFNVRCGSCFRSSIVSRSCCGLASVRSEPRIYRA